jgi:hypothetical protein
MRKVLFTLGVLALVGFLATSTFAANRGPSFKGIGFIHPWDPGNFPASFVWDITDDGSVLMTTPNWTGGGYFTFTTYPGLEWTLGDGSASGFNFNGDGSVVMGGYPGDDGYYHAGTWLGAEGEWDLIPLPAEFEPCGGTGTSYYDMGGDGDYATGLTWVANCRSRGFVWDKATDTTVTLPSMNGESSRSSVISDDGSHAAGFNQKECGWRRGADWTDGSPSWIDGLGENEGKLCGADDSPCCSDRDCPDYVDSYCDNLCDRDNNVCVGGTTPGAFCNWNSDCWGTCQNGANAGADCNSSSACPDDQVCFDNPNYNSEDQKGEALAITGDGNYVAGRQFGESSCHWSEPCYDPYLWASGWRMNPDRSFERIWPNFDDGGQGIVDPFTMSDDGSRIGGWYGSRWTGYYSLLWVEGLGSIDFQLFLAGQGLEDVLFWGLGPITTMTPDGGIVAGYGTNYANPDCPFFGCTEGWVAEIPKVSVCHKGASRSPGIRLRTTSATATSWPPASSSRSTAAARVRRSAPARPRRTGSRPTRTSSGSPKKSWRP